MSIALRRTDQLELKRRTHQGMSDSVLQAARVIVDDVRDRGETALHEYTRRFGDDASGPTRLFDASALRAVLEEIDSSTRNLLERAAARIATFAKAQRESVRDVRISVPGGYASHRVSPVDTAGCYAPGGRYPLPSSVLMTAVTARVAGVREVIVASPRPSVETLAAAAVSGADGLLVAGGAQAIAALAYGIGVPRCDVIAGPGNQWVTAAKQIVAMRGVAGIDLLAGPSELAVVADDNACPDWIAADLLAQAEHDPDAVVTLIATSERMIDDVEQSIARQLVMLSTQAVAREALSNNGRATRVYHVTEAIEVCNEIAPEHLQLHLDNARSIAPQFKHYGALFIGGWTPEALGDYGVGPNHTLPTSGTARFQSGLSVHQFLRWQTQVEIDDASNASGLFDDAAQLAAVEGLEAHAASANIRATEIRGNAQLRI